MDDKERNVKAPRLVCMKKGDKGYGFNLHGERGVVGQYISAVDNGGPAQLGGLCIGDRVVEVNGVNVEAATHSQVVSKIKERVGETTLLVVDKVTDDYLKQHGITITAELAKLDTVVKKVVEKVEVQVEEVVKAEEKESKAEDEGKDEAGDDDVGMSIEDYLKMHAGEDEGKPAEIQVEVTAVDNAEKEEANSKETIQDVPDTSVVSEEKTDEHAKEEASAIPDPEEIKAENKVKMTPPEEPPPAPPSVQATPSAEEGKIPDEPSKEPESEPQKQQEPEPPKEQEPEPPKEPEPSKEPEPPKELEQEPEKKIDPLLKKASLPKPKRKEIKEKKGTDWATRAAIFNNL